MSRAGQTPHGARPNRKGVRGFGSSESGRGHVPARCVQPSGRSLEPRSDARPRGMAVQREQSRGQNSAYRSGCHKLLLSITSKAYRASCDAGVTRLLGQRQRAFGGWKARQLFRQEQPTNHSSAQEQSRNNVTTRSLSGPISKTKPSSSIASHPFLKRCPTNVCRK
jgi:hypothetical protein